jgi:colanic acid biosynthesis glycosyl transferase WcaI
VTGPHRRRRRVTLVNQFYPPDLSPTAHLTASLAAHLAAGGDQVTVITGGEGYVDAPDARSAGDTGSAAVEVVHLWTPALGKGSVLKRLSDYGSFLLGATARLVALPRQDVVISLTTPPFVVVAAVAHRLVHRRARVVLWSMDCYPDVIERLGSRTRGGPPAAGVARRALRPVLSLRRGGPMSRVLRAVNRWAFRRIDHVVALDEPMRHLLLEGYGHHGGGEELPPSTVIPNWEPLDAFPGDAAVAPWSGYDDDALAGRFVVLYTGNLGFGHRVEPVVAAAAALPADAGIAWLFIGGGARWDQLGDLAATAGVADRILRRAYVPREEVAGVMAGADCALILLGDDAVGLMSPSKLHANLAAGLPIVYVGPEGSNVDEAIARFGCGVSLRTDDVDGLVAALCRLRDDHEWHAVLAHNARLAFEEAYCDAATLPQWDEVIDAVTR